MAVSQRRVYGVDVEEIEYLRHGDTPFFARVFRPRGEGPFPAVIDIHGGAWRRGDRTNNDTINEAVAGRGIVVAALDFRNPPQATYPGSVADVNYGVRWLKSAAERFGSRAGMVGSMGTSSGGHLVVLAALKPEDARYAAVPLPGASSVDAAVPYVVTMWPVICPLSRYRTLKARLDGGIVNARWSGLLADQMEYWLTEEAMDEGSANFIVGRGEPVRRPDILYLQHPDDQAHPRANLESFVAGYRRLGGAVELEFFGGEAHDEVRSNPSSEDARRVIDRIAAFIHHRAGSEAAVAAE